jgi:paraquat-inducible protein A
MLAACGRCGAVLRRSSSDPIRFCAAMSAASLVLFAGGLLGNLAEVDVVGQQRTASLLSGPIALAGDGLWELAVPVGFATIAAPLAVTGLLLYVLAGVWLRQPLPGLRSAFAWRNALRPWAMIEVFLVGFFVAYAKLGALVRITPSSGFFALFGFMIAAIAIDAALDQQAVWEVIDEVDPIRPAAAAGRATAARPGLVSCHVCQLSCEPPAGIACCPRCGFTLHRRKPNSLAATVALASAGLVLYFPAKFFPVLTVSRLGQGSPSTILSGVWELLAAGQAPLAAIVFLASVAVPVFKLIGLGAMVLIVVRGPSTHLRRATILYRIVALIGRWSMIDIFMESILNALVKFGAAAEIDPGQGAIAFAAVVILTMISAERFDPRLMWDRQAA